MASWGRSQQADSVLHHTARIRRAPWRATIGALLTVLLIGGDAVVAQVSYTEASMPWYFVLCLLGVLLVESAGLFDPVLQRQQAVVRISGVALVGLAIAGAGLALFS